MKGKIIILILMAFVLINTLVYATNVNVVFDKDSVSKGEKAIASVNIADVSELHSFQFSLKYDDTMLKLDGIEEGNFLSQGEQGKTYLVVRGNTVAVTTLGPKGKSGNGNLFKASFTTLGTGNAELDLTAGKLVNPDLDLIDFDVLPATLTISDVLITPYCGDGKCDAIVGEGCSSCQADCGACLTNEPKEPTNLLPILIAVILLFVIVLIAVIFKKEKAWLVNALIRHKSQKPGVGEESVKKLREYVRYCLSQGYSEESIKKTLIGRGWSPEVVEKAFK